MHFIELEIEARQCATLDALRFAVTNSTRKVAAFDQAFLAEPGMGGSWAITRASSVSSVDQNSPLIRALTVWLAHPRHGDLLQRAEPRQIEIGKEAAEWGLAPEPQMLPFAYWQPFKARDGSILAGLLVCRRDSWRPHQIALLMPLAGAYGHAWEALLPNGASRLNGARRMLTRGRMTAAACIVAIFAAFLPVPMSVLATAEVVAAKPILVTAPIEGVVKDVLLPPGDWVERGTPILEFDDVKLRNDHEVAKRNVAVAEARHFKAVQQATATQKDVQDLATTKAELDVAKAEHAYTSDLLSKTKVLAQSSGLLIYAAKSDLIGKPVTTGERLMEIGNPDATEIRIELPVSDAIALEAGGRVSLFLDGDPLRPVAGTIFRTTYRPSLSAEQQLVFRVHAKFDQDRGHRIGLRGIARVSGEQVRLWFYLFRRPIAAVRQWVGV